MRSRIALLLAGALWGAVAGGGAVVLRWAEWLPALVAPLCLAIGVGAGLVAGFVPLARRHATAALAAAAWVAAIGAAAALGPVVALLVLGRLPEARESRVGAAVGVGMLAVAAVAPVLLRSARRAAGRLARGGRHTTDAVLDRFVTQASAGVAVEHLLRELAVAVRRRWRASEVEIWTGDGGALDLLVRVPGAGAAPPDTLAVEAVERLRRVGVVGPGWLRTWVPDLLARAPAAQVRVAPARHGEHLLALVVLRRARDQERFSPADDRALAETARRLGAALHNHQVDSRLQQTLRDLRRSNAELRASRSRLVSTADAERRRIERDLHDGAQQHLVSLAVGLGLLREVGTTDGPDSLLDQLDQLAVRALEDLRDLAHGVYPALLRDAGLAQALPGAVERSGLRADLDCVPDRFPLEIEAALYFCCLEALQNVTKHASGAAVTIRLRREPGGVLVLEVSDDGPGFDPAAVPPGSGLQNMTDRVGAVGGEVEVRSGPGAGTTVAARVPVGEAG
ncbi:sensor histidine kinase [Cryptosporangium minutisporangium]|uniref:sensor histidine kinase n=1 Tax=Cryptosporangium minutisporangium TaxID=113569 RepID=UPI0035E83B15